MDVAELLAKLLTPTGGLTWTEARERLERYGPNVAVPHKVAAWYSVLWHAFRNLFNYILLGLAIVSWVTADADDPRVLGIPADSALMIAMVVIATGVALLARLPLAS